MCKVFVINRLGIFCEERLGLRAGGGIGLAH